MKWKFKTAYDLAEHIDLNEGALLSLQDGCLTGKTVVPSELQVPYDSLHKAWKEFEAYLDDFNEQLDAAVEEED